MKQSTSIPSPPAGCESCAEELAEILAVGGRGADAGTALTARFRPVADLAAGGIFGHLASIHGPPDSLLFSQARLLGVARRLGRTTEVYRQYFRTVVARFVANRGQGYLLLPLQTGPEELGAACAAMLAQVLDETGLPGERVIAVHAGVGSLDGAELERALAAAQAMGRRGIGLAAGVLACPRSEMLLWSALGPNYVLIDEGVLESLDPNLLRIGRHAELAAAAAAAGRHVIAMGVVSLGLLKILQEIRVDCAAGDFIGKPVAVPTRTLSAAAHKAIADRVSGQASQLPGGGHILEKMLQGIPPVTPDTPADQVFALFERTPDLRAIAVVKNDAPIGLIARYDMVDNMARPYRHELYGRKPCTRFMDEEPLTVDIRLPLSELSEVLVRAHPRHLISGFIITDAGRYLGIGSVQDLVREVTSMQMEAAKYANPLSQLPGNVPINQHIDNLLAAREPCAIAYCDLDHFKPFNDVYGYARGDDVIRLTARILTEACDPEKDFIGHIGGDDFVLVLRSEDWQLRCERALRMFGEEILGFFSRDDIERGGYVTENRKGEMEFHALTSLSIGVAEVRPGAFRSHLEVSVVAAEVKKKAKAIKGNSLYANQRAY
jgi:GGDEF domain-containing protein/EAL domain-containing protein (putative c-di-GMP-specific phosphodiesterase class I)